MAVQGTVEGIQVAALHVMAGALTVTSASWFWGWVPGTISVLAGIAAIVAYGLQIMEGLEKRKHRSNMERTP